MWICSCLAPKAPGEKAAVCQTSDLRLWANWKHQDSGRISKKGSETLPSGKNKTKHTTRANGYLTAWEENMHVSEECLRTAKLWGEKKASLQSACCCFCLTQSSHKHFIWIKERVCTFTGSLTTLSSSARRFLSSHASPKAARQVAMILFSHEGTKFQVDF